MFKVKIVSESKNSVMQKLTNKNRQAASTSMTPTRKSKYTSEFPSNCTKPWTSTEWDRNEQNISHSNLHSIVILYAETGNWDITVASQFIYTINGCAVSLKTNDHSSDALKVHVLFAFHRILKCMLKKCSFSMSTRESTINCVPLYESKGMQSLQ